MAPGTHLLISWISTIEILKNRRERMLVTFTGVLPDADGLGIVVDFITGTTDYYLKFHHYLGHSILSAIIFSTFASLFAKTQKRTVWLLSFFVVHLHILCDVIGSKSPDGFHWPIYYLYPFNKTFELTWKYQWELNAWQNQVILITLLIISFYYVKKKHMTIFEVFSKKLDRAALLMYHKYFG